MRPFSFFRFSVEYYLVFRTKPYFSIEKYGFINLPFRKFFLSDYLSGEKSLENKAMQHKFLERIIQFSNPEKSGGVSVSDRNKRPKIIRTKKPSKEQIKSLSGISLLHLMKL